MVFYESLFAKTDFVHTVIFSVVLVLVLLNYYSSFLRKLYYLSKVPGPPGIPIFGNALTFLGLPKEITKVGLKIIQKYTPIFKIWLGPLPVVVVTGAEAAEVILKSPQCMDKSEVFVKLGGPFTGDSLLMSKVAKWKRNRNIVIRGFTPNILRSYFRVFVEKSEILARILTRELDTGKPFDIFEYVSRTAMDSICASAMGVNLNAQESKSEYFDAVQSGFHLIYQRGFNIWKHPDCIYNLLGESKQFKDNIKTIWELASQIITKKRNRKSVPIDNNNKDDSAGDKNPDGKPLLEFLIDITEKNPEFTDEQLRDEINLLILAGYETSANAISYNLLCLAARKDIQNKVYAELQEVFDDTDRPIEVTDLSKLHYMELTIKESMRLLPTIPLTLRQIGSDIKIGDVTIPGGLNCVICTFQIHRDARVWKNPLEFDPDRFLPENSKHRHPYAYIPFSAGARNCIGMRYSMMFMKTVISTLLRKYEFHTDLKLAELDFCVELSLKLPSGHQVYITPRKKSV